MPPPPARLLALLATTLVAAGAPGPAAAAAERVRAVEVDGNERTSRHVIERALGVSPGDAVDPDDLSALEQQVYNLRIFRSVRVRAEREPQGGVVLRVAVEERRTFLLLPLMGASRGAFRVGGALMDTNLLGLRKELVLIGSWSTRGSQAIALYRDPGVAQSRVVVAAEAALEDVVRERTEGGEGAYSFRDKRADVSVRAGWLLTPRLALRAGWFGVSEVSEPEPGFAAPPRARPAHGPSADLEYQGQDYRDWLNVGPALRARWREGVPALGSDRFLRAALVQGTWAFRVFDGHAASLSTALHLGQGDAVLDAVRLGGRPGTRGFDDAGLWAERAATFTADYQIPIWRPAFGTLTALGFVDAGVLGYEGRRVSWASPGVGVRLYLRNVALPAIGLDVAQSTTGRGPAGSFFLGFGG
ncbi:POTRA domain-containing protein [Anaeromyxobacter paludicola]|uniref:POTRA domain-containing protein n=1 Tax=Anaeromyxobacter paludicola TaxID=2918171 RepID=A0ABM7XAA6_9BACT|nr:POTRA domain-containing protein [Anaeromyxobacter paludicola]BDG08758.1 hypothetical protein AMPC_18710 [Anaeromyxobacter paludicola]